MENNFSKEIVEKIFKGEITLEEVNEQLMESIDSANPEFDKLKISYVNESNNENPTYAKEGDSGFDLRANLTAPVTLGSLERAIIPTGLKFELPMGMEMQVRPRSGLAAKNGITVLNTPGTVDAGYRGEVGVILVNLSKDDFTVNNGERIAQGVISTVTARHIIELEKVDKISEDTERGSGAYGSTGVK
jgi:dUTP pyrophosphatase